MFKTRYFQKTLKKFNIKEKEDENINKENTEKVIKNIIKREEPQIEKIKKKAEKEAKLKPINTKQLLRGFT
jgi:hypothetical protein